MASPSTLYRFRISVSDINRPFYGDLDIRVAMHPSENELFLVTRVIAYALNYEEGLEFSAGLSTPDDPAIRTLGVNGETLKWIDIGNPSARRLHKAAKASKKVLIYTYKNPENLKREVAGENIHKLDEIEFYSMDDKFLISLGTALKRDNTWSLISNDGELVVTSGEETYMGSLVSHQLSEKA